MAVSQAIKRLTKDLKMLIANPLPDAAAFPTNNMLIWHVNFMVPLMIEKNLMKAPLHGLMVFPKDYPKNPPNVGFCTDFHYDMGSEYIETKGLLKGMKVICVDILGNFKDYHTKEWFEAQGTGWTAAYSVETVLVNIQSILIQVDSKMNDLQRQQFYQNCMKYSVKVDDNTHTGENPWPKPLSFEEIAKSKKCKNKDRFLDDEIMCKVNNFAKKAKFTSQHRQEFIDLLENISQNKDTSNSQPEQNLQREEVQQPQQNKKQRAQKQNLKASAANQKHVPSSVKSGTQIIEVRGDLLLAKEQYIAHQCNCVTSGKKGLAAVLFAKFPAADCYSHRIRKDSRTHSKPGTIQVVGRVINMFAQYQPGRSGSGRRGGRGKRGGRGGRNTGESKEQRERWFWSCLEHVKRIPKIKAIAVPKRIGCGLAGGNWQKYFSMLQRFSQESAIRVVIYNFE